MDARVDGNGRWMVVARACAVLAMAALVLGCSGRRSGESYIPEFPAALQVYQGEALPADEVAVVKARAGSSARQLYGFIRSVDGERLPGIFDGRGKVLVLPGEHAFGLGFGPNGFIVGYKDQRDILSVTFQTTAGHTYEIHARARLPKGHTTLVRPTAYVVDATSGEKIESTVGVAKTADTSETASQAP